MKTNDIRRLLIANRGEIALRVMRTAHEMGIETIAIYGDGEEHARHVQYASEAYRIGEGDGLPYLRIPQILEIATRANVDAVHPGYGFLAENAGFVRKVQEAGLKFTDIQPVYLTPADARAAFVDAVADAADEPFLLMEVTDDLLERGD